MSFLCTKTTNCKHTPATESAKYKFTQYASIIELTHYKTFEEKGQAHSDKPRCDLYKLFLTPQVTRNYLQR